MKKRAKYYTDEECPHCGREVRIPARIKPMPKCPRCKGELLPCSACSETDAAALICGSCTQAGSNFKLHKGFKQKKTGFRLGTIIRIADKAYSDATELPMEQNVLHSHKGWRDTGDTLAEFVARELKDIFDAYASKTDQLQEASRVIGRARAQLEDVECALLSRFREELEKEARCRSKKKSS